MRMSGIKNLAAALSLALLLIPSAAHADGGGTLGPAIGGEAGTSIFAQSGRFGLGFGGSNFASGISGKLFLGSALALQGSVGFGYYYGGLDADLDILIEMPRLYSNQYFAINWNFGAGAMLGLGGFGTGIGIEGIAGLSFQLRPYPIELTIEVRPALAFGDWGHYWGGFGGGFDIFEGGAVRWFF